MLKLSQAICLLVVLLCHALSFAGVPTVVTVQSAGVGILDLVLTSTNNEPVGGGTVVDTINVTPTAYAVDGQQPTAVSRYSLPWDEGPSPDGRTLPVTVQHHLYLTIAHPLANGSTHTVTSPYGQATFTYSDTSTYCSAIRVAQGGYSSLATVRYANYAVWRGDGGALRLSAMPAYRVISELTGQTVFSGVASREFDDTTGAQASGEWVYRLPLDAVGRGGPMFVAVQGCGRSRSFTIGAGTATYVITRGLFHQRCGQELALPYTQFTRPACHTRVYDTRTPWVNGFITVPQDAGISTLDMRGLWHDAGDADRRPMHAIIPIALLTYFEAWKSHYVDGQLNLPESGNGIPDFLDEALWGVLGYQYLQVTAPADTQVGGVRVGTEQRGHPAYGVESMATDRGVYGTWSVDGPAGTAAEGVTALVAGIFAQASRLVRPYDAARADMLRDRALLAWAYVGRTYNLSANKPWLMYGALQMYLLTGDASQHDLFRRIAQALVVSGGTWPDQWLSSNLSATVHTTHFVGYLLDHGRPVDAALVTALKNRVIQEADRGGYFSLNPTNVAYPYTASSFLGWGSTGSVRFDAPAFASLFTTDPAKKQQYINTMSVQMDWVTGLNPMNMSFVTGLGTDSPRVPGHLDSFFTSQRGLGPVHGLSVYAITGGWSGQTYQLAVSNKIFPNKHTLPIMKRYAHGWTLLNSNEFTAWETVVWNAAVSGFLYNASQDVHPPPPPLDAGAPDAAHDASLADVPHDSPRDAGADAGAGALDSGVDSGHVADAGPVLMCIQPPPPPPVCGIAYPHDAGAR
jgi:endoglucanase